MPKISTQQSWQYITEDIPEDPVATAFMLPGRITGETPIDPKFNIKEIIGLKQPTSTDMRRTDNIVPNRNEYPFSITYVPLKRISAPKYDFRHFHNMAMNASSATTAGGGWTYGTSITTNLLTFTLFKEIDNLQFRLSGCKITRLTARSSLDNPVEIAVEGMGSLSTAADLSRTDASSITDGVPFWWSDVQVYIDGALATFCTAFEYTIDNKGKSNHVLGDRDPKGVVVTGRSIDLSITRQFNDLDEYIDAKNGTAKSVTIVLDDATDANIRFRDCKYDDHPIPGTAISSAEILTHILRLKAEEMSTN